MPRAAGVSVGKTWVAERIRDHQYARATYMRAIKHRVPPPIPTHAVWGIDLTFKHDQAGRRHPIFGVLDHGSRMAVVLKPLTDTTAITLLRALLDAIEALGRSTAIRSDNESMFHSRLVKRALAELRAPAPARTTPVGGGGAGAWPAEFFVNVVGAWQDEPLARAARSGRVSVAQ